MSEASRSYRSSGHRGRSRSRDRLNDDYRATRRPSSQERHRSHKPDGDERLSHRSRGREDEDNYRETHSSSRRRPDSRDREDDRRAHSSRRSRSPPPSSRRRRSNSYSDSERRKSKTKEHHKSSHSKHRQRHASGSSDDSSSSDDEETSDRKNRKKKSSHRRDRSESVDSSKGKHKKESKEERRERKRRKKEKREKKKLKKNGNSSKHKGVVNEYGKFGIISEADMFTKDQEFRAWLVEEKMLNPETVPVSKMKELFRVYMEDYNTATLPHEKFYALEKYESKMNAIRSGQTTTGDLGYDPRADEAALAAQHKRVAKTDGEVYIGRAQLEELRKLERDRVEASRMKRMGMEVKESMGVRYERD